MDDQTRHQQAQAAGRAEGEAFVASLRRVEEQERVDRLTRLAASETDWTGAEGEPAPTEVARLKAQVEALAAFRTAVLDSKPWRLIQSVRRLVGRDW